MAADESAPGTAAAAASPPAAPLGPAILSVATSGLGNESHLVAVGDEAIVVDPPRDAWRVMAAAHERGWRIRAVLETHVHNDYLSGAREIRASEGAEIVAPAGGHYRFTHRPADEGDRLELGSFELVARATPGHTPEHLSWEVRQAGGRPLAILSGGSLLVGGVGRTDLLGPGRTSELTAAQFATLRRFAELPDEVVVYPTHGAGSFCVAAGGDLPSRASIGSLRRWNPAFRAPDLASFERELADGRTRYPTYYRRMGPLNRRGPRLLGGPPRPAPLSPPAFRAARSEGAWVIDVRDRRAFARGHVAGSLNVELGESLASYVGWLLPFDAPIGLVVDDQPEAVEAASELSRIGYDRVLGFLEGGLSAWEGAGGRKSRYPVIGLDELRAQAAGEDAGPGRIIDVRQPVEWRAGAIPGSRRVFVADLPAQLGTLDREGAWTVVCRSGSRSAIAASLLDAAGFAVRLVARGGVPSLPPSELAPA